MRYNTVPDYRGIPTAVCPCGSTLINITASFDEDYVVSYYLLDNATCYSCGSLLTAPTPLDIKGGANGDS